MSPGKRTPRKSVRPATVRAVPLPDDTYEIAYYQRHVADDPGGAVPGQEFLNSCPPSVRAKFRAVLVAVAEAPPHRFAGGGYWEAMHGLLSGYHEVRVDGPGRMHYRLFCRLDTDAQGQPKPLLTILCGATKPFRTEFSDAVYRQVLAYGREYLARNPRSII